MSMILRVCKVCIVSFTKTSGCSLGITNGKPCRRHEKGANESEAQNGEGALAARDDVESTTTTSKQIQNKQNRINVARILFG